METTRIACLGRPASTDVKLHPMGEAKPTLVSAYLPRIYWFKRSLVPFSTSEYRFNAVESWFKRGLIVRGHFAVVALIPNSEEENHCRVSHSFDKP